MLKFDPSNPFPLLEPGSHTYAEAQAHSALVDAWLGLETEKIEDSLCENVPPYWGTQRHQELWVGLPVKSLLTPYTEIRLILSQINLLPGSTIVDLGAGYGRMAFVIGRHHPDLRFIGYEIVKERVVESLRCLATANHGASFENVCMYQADLSDPDFKPEAADSYFLYDYGSRDAIAKTLQDLQEIAQNRAITVIGRGRSSRDAIDKLNPWLSQVVPPRHFEHYSIYRSAVSV